MIILLSAVRVVAAMRPFFFQLCHNETYGGTIDSLSMSAIAVSTVSLIVSKKLFRLSLWNLMVMLMVMVGVSVDGSIVSRRSIIRRLLEIECLVRCVFVLLHWGVV